MSDKFKFTEEERKSVKDLFDEYSTKVYLHGEIEFVNPCIDRIESIISDRDGWIKPTPLPVSFLEWVSFSKYMRLSESAGHKWFKLGDNVNLYTTEELYDLFVYEVNDENRHELHEKENIFPETH